MRVKNAFKNILISIISSAFVFLVGLLIRKILLDSFDLELLAYDGLLSDIFSYITLIDFGSDSLFTYRLYEAFANKDETKISKLINMYRIMFRVIGTAILILCVLVFFVLPYIFADKVHFWNYFKIMFFLYSISALSSYYVGYWRYILAADQKEYIAISVESIFNIISLISKAIILITTKDFILYLVINTCCNVFAKFFIRHKSKKEYTYQSNLPVSFSDFKEDGMLKDSIDLIFIKLSDTITWSSSNLLISILIDVSSSGLFYNYSMIANTFSNLVARFIFPMNATLADLVYKEDKKIAKDFYNIFNLACFFIASITLTGFLCCLQPVISIIFGNQYLLNFSFVLFLSIQFYITEKNECDVSFRNCFGEFKTSKFYSLLSVLLNILVSIILSKYIGITGIVVGSVIGTLILWHSRLVIVKEKFFNDSMIKTWLNEMVMFIIALLEGIFVYKITFSLDYSFYTLLIRGGLSVVIPSVINIVLFYKTKSFKGILNIIKDITSNIRRG